MKQSDLSALQRRNEILAAALDCFLKFGFQKTSLEDIAKAARISRPLIYVHFKNKEDIFEASFNYLIGDSHEKAKAIVDSKSSKKEKLIGIFQVLVLEPWKQLSGKPMEEEFYNTCGVLFPETSARHEAYFLKCATTILGDKNEAEVLSLSAAGLHADLPTPSVLQKRFALLTAKFVD